MHSFLGVPIVLRGVVFGNLYLTEKAGEADFTAEDEELVTLLAAQAAVADRERPPLRGGDTLVDPARVADRGRATRSRPRPTVTACST